MESSLKRSMEGQPSESEDAPKLQARTISSIAEIAPEIWDACAGSVNPFVSHTFLSALEESGSCTSQTGWLPQHLVLEELGGSVLGTMPLYLKNHSQGEYVFDHGWAQAFENAGGSYYPKLQASIPFTPATGPRLLIAPGDGVEEKMRLLLQAAVQIAEKYKVSSLHFTFPTDREWKLMGEAGLLQRTGEQFHWSNDGYKTFDDFLATLTSRKRKSIKRERRKALESGVSLEILSGAELQKEHWDSFYDFYINTGNKKWGTPYLTRSFFNIIHERMADQIVLIMVQNNGRYIAGALNFLGKDTLYGRHWGCIEEHDCLHFEVCYYQAIEFAINNGLKFVEAGAQGSHKVHRGYLPKLTYSAHWIRNEGFRGAVKNYLASERKEINLHVDAIEEIYSPYKQR